MIGENESNYLAFYFFDQYLLIAVTVVFLLKPVFKPCISDRVVFLLLCWRKITG